MVMFYIYAIYVFVLGLLIGSFLNVCIYRIPIEQSIVKPPSHCMSCGERLKILDLIPVFSYLFLKGRCRHCKEKFSPRYLFVELITAVVFVVLLMKYYNPVEFIASIFLMSILIVVLFIDFDHMIIPNGVVITGLVGGAVLVIYNIFFTTKIFGEAHWWGHLLGILPGTGFLLLTFVISLIIYKSDEGMGMGDVKIFAPIGIFLGWKLCLVALFFSVVSGGVISIILLITKIKGRKDAIPFGPYIVLGTFITLLFGREILKLYLG